MMHPPKSATKAYSYLRFSTPEQAKGDSLRRQVALAEEYAARHGLELDDTLTYHDTGVSAYRGRNVEEGKLGDFLEAVREGLVEQGSVLLVESLDRISRQLARRALRTLEAIVDEGVTVVTLSDGKAYTRANLDDDPMALMMALMIFIRANEESATKARRVKAAWSGKVEKAADKPLTARGPAWLRLVDGPEGRRWEVLEERAAVVRKIFLATAYGVGQNAIAQRLNRENVPVFGRGRHWHRSYVAKILENPAVIGTLVPHTLEYQDGKRTRKPRPGAPVEGYYPAVVDPELYQKVQAMAQTRSPLRGRHVGENLRNAIGGLARCPTCESSMIRVMKGSNRKKAGRPKLVCYRAKTGAGCAYRSVDYGQVERALRSQIEQAVASAPAGSDAMDEAIEQSEGSIRGCEAMLDELLDAVAGGALQRSPAVAQRIRETEAELEALRERHNELLRDAAAHMGPMVARRLEALRAALSGDGELDVVRANTALRQTVSSVLVDHEAGQLVLMWQHGGQSLIQYGWPREN
jgi:DNA invertase Pin-like site-specific DNA recombinase